MNQNHHGDDIIQPNGVSIPILTDFSSFDFEFFSDEEDNCIVVDTVVQSTENPVENQTNTTSTSLLDSKEYEKLSSNISSVVLSPLRKEELKYVTVSTSTNEESQQSIMIQTDTKMLLSTDTQTISEKKTTTTASSSTETTNTGVFLADQESNTNILDVSDCAIQTDPVTITSISAEDQEQQKLTDSMIVHPPEDNQNHNKEKQGFQSIANTIKTVITAPAPSAAVVVPTPTSPIAHGPSYNNKFDFVTDPSNMKISFLEFAVGDIALFVPVDEKKDYWMAFHSNRPYRFLAQESLENFLNKDRQRMKAASNNNRAVVSQHAVLKERSRILGRIILIDTHITTKEENPYKLPEGTIYYICYVEPLLVPKKKDPSSSSSHQKPSASSP